MFLAHRHARVDPDDAHGNRPVPLTRLDGEGGRSSCAASELVANTNSDTVSVSIPETAEVVKTILVHGFPGAP